MDFFHHIGMTRSSIGMKLGWSQACFWEVPVICFENIRKPTIVEYWRKEQSSGWTGKIRMTSNKNIWSKYLIINCLYI